MFRRSKSFLGLDLGSQSIKAVEISLDGHEPVITGFAKVEIPPGGERTIALGQLLQEGRFRTRNVVTAVAGQSVVVRYITMMQMSDSELRQAIRFESDKYLPFDADEVLLDCQRLQRPPMGSSDDEGKSDQMNVVLAACRTATVDSQLAEISAHGLNPVAVDVDVFALANSWELIGLDDDDEEVDETIARALVDVGAARTQINVLAEGETCFSREIGIGGGDMTQAISRRLGMEIFDAEAVKRDPGEREVEVSRAIGPVLEDLVSELSLSLDYVENREGLRVDEVLLSGGGSLAPGTAPFIEHGTGRSARPWSPLTGVRVDEDRVDLGILEDASSSLAVAIGLAARVCAA